MMRYQMHAIRQLLFILTGSAISLQYDSCGRLTPHAREASYKHSRLLVTFVRLVSSQIP